MYKGWWIGRRPDIPQRKNIKSALADYEFRIEQGTKYAVHQARCLALANIHANGARVVVLEVVEREVARRTHLVRDRLARGASTRRDNV
jgi:hypothetical protein